MTDDKPTYQDLEQRILLLEQELHDKNERLSLLMYNFDEIQELAKTGHWELDLIQNKLYWSEEIYRIFECSPHEFEATYEAFLSFIHPDDRDYVNSSFQNHLISKTPYNIIHRVLLKDGSIKFVNERCKSDFDSKGKPIRSLGTVVDITDSIQTEKELKLAREKAGERERNLQDITTNLETFFNTIDDFLFVTDEQGIILLYNKTVETRLGYTMEELKGKSILSVHPEEQKNNAAQVLANVTAGELYYFQIPLVTKQGKHINVETHISAGKWNRKPALLGVSKDITKQKLSEEIFYTSFYLNPSACGLSDTTSGKYIEVNEAFTDFFGYTKEETIGHSSTELNIINSKTRATILSNTDSSGRIFNTEAELTTKNGDIKRVILSGQIIHIQDASYLYTIVHDVTEIHKAKEIAEENEQKFSIAFHSSPNISMITNIDTGEVLEANDAVELVAGFSRTEIIGNSVINLNLWINMGDRDKFIDLMFRDKKVLNFESNFRKKSGEAFIGLISGQMIRIKNQNCLLSVIHDITNRKNAEIELLKAKEKVEESESKFKDLYESLSIAYLTLKDGVCIECNEATVSIFGVESKSEVIGKSPTDFSPEFQLNHLKSSEEAKQRMQTVILEGFLTFEWLALRKEKELFYSEVSLKRYYYKNELHIQCLITDITKRKKDEKELIAAKEKAEESDRLKTAFLHNMSHEIRTPLNAISGFTGLLNDPDNTEEILNSYIQIIQNNSAQLVSIVSDILTISSLETKQEPISISNVCINDLLAELQTIFIQKAEEKKISLCAKYQLTNHQSEIFTDRTKITQIVSNLLTNALKFTHDGFIEFGYQLKDKYLEFYVKDSGIGIKPEFQDKIFERFHQADQSINKLYGGTGLGLAISKAYVELLGGKIWVQSEMEKGSTFFFTIPYNVINKKDGSL
jgi:PAS domain S-box-containing protein